jgi:hypothetical protein
MGFIQIAGRHYWISPGALSYFISDFFWNDRGIQKYPCRAAVLIALEPCRNLCVCHSHILHKEREKGIQYSSFLVHTFSNIDGVSHSVGGNDEIAIFLNGCSNFSIEICVSYRYIL